MNRKVRRVVVGIIGLFLFLGLYSFAGTDDRMDTTIGQKQQGVVVSWWSE